MLELLYSKCDFDGFPWWHQVALRILLTCHSLCSARDIIFGDFYPSHVSAKQRFSKILHCREMDAIYEGFIITFLHVFT